MMERNCSFGALYICTHILSLPAAINITPHGDQAIGFLEEAFPWSHKTALTQSLQTSLCRDLPNTTEIAISKHLISGGSVWLLQASFPGLRGEPGNEARLLHM